MHPKTKRTFQFTLTLLLAVALAFSAFLTQSPGRVMAGPVVVAGWSSSIGWNASSGSSANLYKATLSTNTTNPFVTSSGAPDGESGVYISYGWANGSLTKYWKVQFNSTGFRNLTVSSQQKSTNLNLVNWNGPRDFKLQYSLDDSTWTDVPGGPLVLSKDWSAGGKLASRSLPSAVDNQPHVYLRWIMTSNTSVNPTYPTTDNDAQSMIAGIYIHGEEIPAAPTGIQLSGTTIYSGEPPGTLIGKLSAIDTNEYDTWTYSLVSGPGDTHNSFFNITGDKLTNNAYLPAGDYSIRVNVNDGAHDFAEVFTITSTAYPPITGGSTMYNDYITRVIFAGIDHSSDTGSEHAGYEDFTAITGTVLRGNDYPLSATVNVGCPDPPVDPACGGITYPQYIKAWFDWNRNGSFDDDGEAVDIHPNTASNGPHTVTVRVPATAELGATRMRIATSADLDEDQNPPAPPNAGPTYFIGQAEDYTIIVTGLTITTGAVSGSPFYISATQGASVEIPYTITGTYTEGNVFTAYLSDASGDFTGEIAIGSVAATGAGTISAVIPAGLESGSGYRVRVKSSSPAITGSDNGSNLTIVLDTTAPVVSVPSDQTVEATGPSGATYTFTATATDVSPTHPTVTCDPASGSTFPLGPTTVTCSATDTVGNVGSSTFTVTVQDTTPPAITTPSNPVVEATGPSGAVYIFTATATDLVAPANPEVSCVPASGSLFPVGDTTVTCTASDAAGNTGDKTFTVTVQDTTPPVITVPANATVEATGPSGAVYTFTATATDLVDPASPTVTCTPASGSNFPLGTTTVTCSASDAAGNTGSSTFTVTVQDTTAPVVTVPSNAIIEATGPSGAVHFFTATAADLVTPFIPAVSCTPASGSTFPLGDTTVTCEATDMAGNTGSSTFTVTVRDTTPPVVTAPADTTLEATGPTGAVYTFTATAMDLVDLDSPEVSCSPASGSVFPVGDTTVTCEATDAAGNTGSDTFTVTVTDTTPPVITVPADATIEATGPAGAPYTFTATAEDLVDQDGSLVTCAPASGSTFPLGDTTVTCEARDTAGNTASGTFTVTVQDTTGPVVTVPAHATVEATGPGGAVYTFSASAKDLVDPSDLAVICTPPSGSTFPLGATTVTCSATDSAGNTGSNTFTVTVQDTTAPVVTVPGDVVLEATAPVGKAYTFTATATDLVAPASPAVTCTPASGSIFPLGVTTVTCSATDAAGNTGSKSFTVSVWMERRYYLPIFINP